MLILLILHYSQSNITAIVHPMQVSDVNLLYLNQR